MIGRQIRRGEMTDRTVGLVYRQLKIVTLGKLLPNFDHKNDSGQIHDLVQLQNIHLSAQVALWLVHLNFIVIHLCILTWSFR